MVLKHNFIKYTLVINLSILLLYIFVIHNNFLFFYPSYLVLLVIIISFPSMIMSFNFRSRQIFIILILFVLAIVTMKLSAMAYVSAIVLSFWAVNLSKRYYFNDKFTKYILFICMISAISQMARSDTMLDRYVLSIGDPNFTGMQLLYLCIVCLIYKFRLGVLFCVVAIPLVLSRDYFISMFILLLGNLFINKNFIPRTEITSIIMYFSFIIVSYIVLSGVVNTSSYDNSILRLVRIFDGTNYFRFNINLEAIHILFADSNYLYRGVSSAEYTSIMSEKTVTIPHNTIIQYSFLYGIAFTIVYSISLMTIFNENKKTQVIFASLIFFSLFLHGSLNPAFILLVTFSFTLCAFNENNSTILYDYKGNTNI
jgi:hypothetical protein